MSTNNDKNFLTYNQQMRKLRDKKKIICNGSSHKRMLIRAGYFKYFLPATEYRDFVSELKSMIFALKGVIDPAAFDNIRGQMGIAQLEDLDTLVSLEKGDIEYNKFDKF